MTGWRAARAADIYRRAGWPVLAGACWSTRKGRFVCTVDACRTGGPHPLVADAGGLHTVDIRALPTSMLTSAAAPGPWRRPHAVILPTGVVCDVVDAPAAVGRRITRALIRAGHTAPVALLAERWLVFVAPGTAGDVAGVEAAAALGALVHTWGSWVMLPPSKIGDRSRCQWLRPPWRTRWCMPPLGAARGALVEVRREDGAGSGSAPLVKVAGRCDPADLTINHAIGR
jgi:hypothetical protein